MAGSEKEEGRRPGRWFADRAVALTFIAIIVGAEIAITVVANRVPAPRSCSPTEHQLSAAASTVATPPDSTNSKTFELVDDKQTQIDLGRDNNPARTAIAFRTDTTPNPDPKFPAVRLAVQSLRRGENGDVRAAATAYGVFTSAQQVVVFLCVERQGQAAEWDGSFELDPGTYKGVISLLDPRFPTTTVPFTVNLAFPNQWDILMPIGGVILLGALYLMVLRRPPGVADERVGLRDLDAFLRKPSGVASVIAGTVAASGVYLTTYYTNDSWGAGIDFYLLVAAMFSAFISAGTAFRFISNLDMSPGSAPPTGPRPDAQAPGVTHGTSTPTDPTDHWTNARPQPGNQHSPGQSSRSSDGAGSAA
jgi:hypothetical protein